MKKLIFFCCIMGANVLIWLFEKCGYYPGGMVILAIFFIMGGGVSSALCKAWDAHVANQQAIQKMRAEGTLVTLTQPIRNVARCAHCDAPLNEGVQFCGSCGAPVSTAPEKKKNDPYDVF